MQVTRADASVVELVPSHGQGYEPCEQCGAPLEQRQRYCVMCGKHARHADDPVAGFMASAGGRARAAAAARAGGAPARRRATVGLGTAAAIALAPAGVALGVLAGRSGSGSDDKLIAALRAQRVQVVTVGAAASAGAQPAAAAAAPASAPASSFGLAAGYTVELGTLPRTASGPAVAAAEQADRAHGAGGVGLISQADFRVTPAPAGGAYVIYAGQYASRAAAEAARVKLAHAFPHATVIAVKRAGASSGAVLAKSNYGSAHQVSGFKPSSSQTASGAAIVNRVAKQIGSNYVGSQKGLPDQIVVP